MSAHSIFTTTEAKHSIQTTMVAQWKQFLKTHDNVMVNSLPETQWVTEAKMFDYAKRTGKHVEFFCYENDYRKDNIKYAPPRLQNAIRDPESQLNVRLNFTYGQFEYKQKEGHPCFSWPDYCGVPFKTEINRFSKAIRPDDVIYLTFLVNPRSKTPETTFSPEIYEAIKKRRYNDSLDSRASRLKRELEKVIKHKGINFTEILYKPYINGGITPMMTVGWHFQANSPLAKIN